MTSFRSQLIGTWELLEYSCTSENDPSDVVYPPGKACNGRIVYSDDGYMSSFLQADDVEPYKDERVKGTVDELAAAALKTIAYCGPAYVNEEPGAKQQKIVHHCRFSLPPNLNNTVQHRVAEFVHEGGERLLVLRPATAFVLDDGVARIHRLKWRKAPRNEDPVPPAALSQLGKGYQTKDEK